MTATLMQVWAVRVAMRHLQWKKIEVGTFMVAQASVRNHFVVVVTPTITSEKRPVVLLTPPWSVRLTEADQVAELSAVPEGVRDLLTQVLTSEVL